MAEASGFRWFPTQIAIRCAPPRTAPANWWPTRSTAALKKSSSASAARRRTTAARASRRRSACAFSTSTAQPITEPLGGGRSTEIYAIDMSRVNPGLRTRHDQRRLRRDQSADRATRVHRPSTDRRRARRRRWCSKLDRNLGHLSALIKRDLNTRRRPIVPAPVQAAASGAGLMAFTNAVVKRGVELVVAATQARRAHEGRDARASQARAASTSRPHSERRLPALQQPRVGTTCP